MSLLNPLDSATVQAYYAALLGSGGGLEVRLDAGNGKGKGLFATRDIKMGEVVLTERPLAGTQDLDSKLEVTTCAHCYTAVGTVEQAFGGKICMLINELSEASEADDLQEIQARVDKVQAAVDSKRLEGLLCNAVQLPLSDRLGIPADPVKCRSACGEEYCCSQHEAAAWARQHCLLCPGPAAASGGSSHAACGSSGGGGSSSSSSSRRQKKAAQPPAAVVHGVTVDRAQLAAFFEHADQSNDIFRVAAQVVAATLVTADTLLQQAAGDALDDAEAAAAVSEAAAAAAGARTAARMLVAAGVAADSTEQQQPPQPQQQQQQPTAEQCQAALRAAFLPFAVAHKAPWWDVAAAAETAAREARSGGGADEDADARSDDEEAIDPAELAAQLRELAAESLSLLAAGLRDSRFPQLFELQLYGNIIGMFELNNLALTVPAPVGRYRAMLTRPADAGISPAEAAAALAEVQPLFDALGDAADGPAEGTGFFAVQSTMNHSCDPNAAADCLPSGDMVVTALRDIPAGSEVLLSYIEQEGADLRQRRAMLADYGFACRCARCESEALADSLAVAL